MGIAQCTGCGAKYRVPEKFSKPQFTCKKCQTVVMVPSADPAQSVMYRQPPPPSFQPPAFPKRPRTVISAPPPPPPNAVLDMASAYVAPQYAPGFGVDPGPVLTRHHRLAARGCFSIAALQLPAAALMLLFGLVMLLAGGAVQTNGSTGSAALGAVGLIVAFFLGAFGVALLLAGINVRRGSQGWVIGGIVVMGLIEAATLLFLLIDLSRSGTPKSPTSHAGGYGFLIFYAVSSVVIGHVLFHLIMAARQNPQTVPVDDIRQGGVDFLATLLGAVCGFVLAVLVRVVLSAAMVGFTGFATILLLTTGGAAGGFCIGRARQREREQAPTLWWEDGAQGLGVALVPTIMIAWMMAISSTRKQGVPAPAPAGAPAVVANNNPNPPANPAFNPALPNRPPTGWQPTAGQPTPAQPSVHRTPTIIRRSVNGVPRQQSGQQSGEPGIPSAAETAAAVQRIQSYWQPSNAVPKEILTTMTGATADANGVINLPAFRMLRGADRVRPPVTYRIICLTRGQDFRISYSSQAIFNWEMDASQFRIDFGPTGSQHKAGTGAVTADQWVGIEMVVLPNEIVMYVDGQERFRTSADFSNTLNSLRIENHGNRQMLIESVQMLQPGN